MNNGILGIFVFFDKDGIVDDYVKYLIDAIKPFLKKLIVVSNGYLNKKNRDELIVRADEYFERENRGFDFGAWKEIFCYRFSRDYWDTYETVLCFNDTFYGPIFPLDDVFEKIMTSNGDLWGLTRFGRVRFQEQFVPFFIQTYFWAVNARLLHSDIFFEFWKSVNEEAESFLEIQNCEIMLSKFVLEKGFTIETYIDTEEYEVCESAVVSNRQQNRALDKLELPLLIRKGFPFIKRKNFFYPRKTINEVKIYDDLAQIMRFVSEKTSYRTDMILDNIIRLKGPQIVSQALNLNFVIKNVYDDENITSINNIFVIAAKTNNNKEFLTHYLEKCNVPELLTISDCKLCFHNMRKKTSLYTDIYELLCKKQKIEFVCILGDFNHSGIEKTTYASYQTMLYDNLIGSMSLISQILKILSESKYIGGVRPILRMCDNNRYIKGKEPVGIWVKKDILMEYLQLAQSPIFETNQHTVLNELIYEIGEFILKRGYMIAKVIADNYASVLLTNYELDLE